MTTRYDYKVFPTTWKARLLLAAAAITSLSIWLAYVIYLSSGPLETGVWVTFENRTAADVTVFFEHEAAGTVPPHSQDDIFLRYSGWSSKKRLIEVRGAGGRKLLELSIGRPGLSDQDWRIIVADQ